MPIADTSAAAYSDTSSARLTHERALFRLYKAHPEGLSDRQVGKALDLTPNLASARRNGLSSRLAGTEWKLVLARRDKCETTHKTVQFWTIRNVGISESQGSLF